MHNSSSPTYICIWKRVYKQFDEASKPKGRNQLIIILLGISMIHQ